MLCYVIYLNTATEHRKRIREKVGKINSTESCVNNYEISHWFRCSCYGDISVNDFILSRIILHYVITYYLYRKR
jgi:hypothetical protein